jgi:hypothetical protein
VVETCGRTTVGTSGLEIEDARPFIAAYLKPELSSSEVLRLACEDDRAFYLEAAAAAKVIISFRTLCLKREDESLRALVGLLVSRTQLHRTG